MAAGNLTIALAQLNPTVGAVEANARRAARMVERARAEGADLVLLPEQALGGYPAEDLYLKRHFLDANERALRELAATARGIAVLAGFAEPRPASATAKPADAPAPRIAHNSLALLRDGGVEAVYRKQRLPNYSVFDERRYFEPGAQPLVVEVAGVRIGLTICEDAWEPGPPATDEAAAGARLIVNASGSPYHRGKLRDREAMFARRAVECGAAFAFCNLVGGQDELVFDGASFVMAPDGSVLARARQFEEELLVADLGSAGTLATPLDELDEVYAALVLGLRDYAVKNGFDSAVLGLSGGIDSALVALLACDALGPERVSCVVMPSPHSSDATQADARAVARNLGARLVEMPIAGAMRAYDEALEAGTGRPAEALAAENLQARIRGNLVMALSNDEGSLALATGNKSEMSVGYATLYGDMAGGFAPIKDVPKTLVYELLGARNARSPTPPVPSGVFERPPSAELRPEQRDTDSLPPYDVLDRILAGYVEGDRPADEIAADGVDPRTVAEVLRLVDRAEYKRRQAAPGVRITPKAFGRDRRLPITNRFRG